MESNTYTEEEINANVSKIKDIIYYLEKDRTEITLNINSLKKQISDLKALNTNQCKLL